MRIPPIVRDLEIARALSLLLLLGVGTTVPAGRGYAQSPDSTAVPPPGTAQTSVPSAKLGGYAQVRETFRDEVGLSATINRARLSVDGTLPARLSYRVMAEYEATAGVNVPAVVSLRDALIRWSRAPWTVSAGQYKSPMSREFLMSITIVETPDRSLMADSLATRRDVGLSADWSPGPDVTLSAGVFNGEGQNVITNRDSTVLFVGRAVGRPLPWISLGGGVGVSGEDTTRYAAEAGVDLRGFSFRTEFISLVRTGAPDDEGWYFLAGYRVRPELQLVVRQESLSRNVGPRPSYRVDLTTAGAVYDFAGGRARALLDIVFRNSSRPFDSPTIAIGQFQVRF